MICFSLILLFSFSVQSYDYIVYIDVCDGILKYSISRFCLVNNYILERGRLKMSIINNNTSRNINLFRKWCLFLFHKIYTVAHLTGCEKYNIVLFIYYWSQPQSGPTSRWLQAGSLRTQRRRTLLYLPPKRWILFSSMKWLYEDGTSRNFGSSSLATVVGVRDDSLNICKNNIWSQVCSKSERELDCCRTTVACGHDPMPVCSMLVWILTERTYRKKYCDHNYIIVLKLVCRDNCIFCTYWK